MDKYKDQEEVYSQVLRAGNRSYFFDIKRTKKDDLYLIITESKKKFKEDGKFFYEKHKIFLYQEDFNNFTECLENAVQFAHDYESKEEFDNMTPNTEIYHFDSSTSIVNEDEIIEEEFVNLEFEDLQGKI